eukprot:3137174-Prymnesium_polylepis.1
MGPRGVGVGRAGAPLGEREVEVAIGVVALADLESRGGHTGVTRGSHGGHTGVTRGSHVSHT